MSRIVLSENRLQYPGSTRAESVNRPSASADVSSRWRKSSGGLLGWVVTASCVFLSTSLLAEVVGSAADAERPDARSSNSSSLEGQVRRSIARGVDYLLRSQNPGGWWSNADQPAVTSLALTALCLEPTGAIRGGRASELNRGFDYVLASARPDGSIQRVGLANYNTAVALVALTVSGDRHFLPVIAKARQYLASTQTDFDRPGVADNAFDGGIGYGSKYQHSDMNNTLMALEAMRVSEKAMEWDTVQPATPPADLNWKAVVAFIQNCQNLPGTNKADWVSNDIRDRGGFVYYPGQSMAGGVTNAQTGRVALRSYGSMSYGGLLSYVHARLDRNDARVVAVKRWLLDNYTLEENPGMGRQGYFYYLHLMTKALSALGEDQLVLDGGRKIAWREEVTTRLLALQSADGSWANTEGRWWEQDPVLVTSYALLTLEMMHKHAIEPAKKAEPGKPAAGRRNL